jgi:uncharacterized protein (TIGR02266 family)
MNDDRLAETRKIIRGTMKSEGQSKLATEAVMEAWQGSEVVIVHRAERADEGLVPRVQVILAVNVETESNFYAGFTENLSECGVFVATHAPLQIGSTVELSVKLPENETIRAHGTVRWVRPYSESTGMVPGMGVRFDGLSSHDSARIQAFCEARAPMFFDDESVEDLWSAT